MSRDFVLPLIDARTTKPVPDVAMRLRCAAVLLPSLLLMTAAPCALATPFTDASGTDTTSHSLTGTDAGSVASGATLSTSGVAVTWTGSSGSGPSLTNSGTIQSTGGRALDMSFNGSNSSFTLNNNANATISSGSADTFRINKDIGTGTVTVNNSGTMQETGTTGSTNGQVLDFDAIGSSGHVTINNSVTGKIQAADSDAIRPGGSATINNSGTITAGSVNGDTGNDGIDYQSQGGGTLTNFATGTITGARHGVTGKTPVTIDNRGAITGQDGSGINFDTASNTTMTVTNTGTITGNAVTQDGDGIDIDGLAVINNHGTVKALGIVAGELSEAVTIGGGTINNFSDGTLTSVQRAITVDNSALGNAFGPTTINNDGAIIGGNGEAIRITSDAATSNTLNNKGSITGSVTMGSGADTLNLYTGSSISGAIDGGGGGDTIHLLGTGTGTLGTVQNVASLKLDTGTWSLTGTQTYTTGVTVAAGATAKASGTINGAFANNGTVRVNGGTVTFNGTFTNSGAYVSDPSTQHFTTFNVTSTGYIQAAAGDKYVVTSNFGNNSTQKTSWQTNQAALDFAAGTGGTPNAHTMAVAGADLGATGAGYSDNFAWGSLTLDIGQTLTLTDGRSDATTAAFYVDQLIGEIVDGNNIDNIFGNGIDIYYDIADNADLRGLTYALAGGGELIGVEVPEPGTLALIALPFAGLALTRRRRAA